MRVLGRLSLAAAIGLLAVGQASAGVAPKRGAASLRPARRWEEALVTGNGRMGAMVHGHPLAERIVANHCRLFLPLGSLSGILARGQIQINRLQWNASEGALHLELTSGKEQTLTLRLPTKDRIRSIAVDRGPAAVRESPRGPNSREVDLPKGRPVALDLRF